MDRNIWQWSFNKFDWTKCSAVAIPEKVNEVSVVAIVAIERKIIIKKVVKRT